MLRLSADARRAFRPERTSSVLLVALLVVAGRAFAAPVSISNGIAGDGRYQVVVDDAGDTFSVKLDPTGATPLQSIVGELQSYIDVGADGGGTLLQLSSTAPAASTGLNQVTSAGAFVGQNGTIQWTAVSSIPPGTTAFVTTFSFTSSAPFGVVRFVSYLDGQVGAGPNVLVESGMPGEIDFSLLTLDQTPNIGIGQTLLGGPFLNASYRGWSADQYHDLRDRIEGPGAAYSLSGVVNTTNLPAYVDSRYPGLPAFGPADITEAMALDLSPTATTASITIDAFGIPANVPADPSAPSIPTLDRRGLAALALAFLLAGAIALRRRVVR